MLIKKEKGMKRLVLGVMVAGLIAATTSVFAEDMVVAKGKKVAFDYTLTVDKETVETTQGKQPLEYVQGEGMLIPGLEREMEGMKAGDAKTVTVKPEDGYGTVNAQLVREFDKSKLPADMKPEKGMVLEMQDPQGNAYPCTITEVKDKSVMLDFNHPLAGKELTFDVKVVSVQDAPAAPAAAPAASTEAAAPAAEAPAAK